ncbi:MAG: thioesterase family protein [Flavobacteriales bacterium]
MSITTRVQVRFSDVDLARHVHNAAYLQYFELGRMDLLRRFMEKEHEWMRTGLILARNEVDYRKPIHLADDISVETSCTKLGNKSFDLSYTIFSMKEGQRQLHAEGRSVMVCFDYSKNATIPLPEEWRSALARMMKDADHK